MVHLLEEDSTSGPARAALDDSAARGIYVVDWGGASERGHRRDANEDAWSQFGSIFVVADGMGGLDRGAAAAWLSVESLIDSWLTINLEDQEEVTWSSLPRQSGPEDVVRDVNAKVCQLAAAHQQRVGCTMTAVRISRDRAIVVHVGDSRAYRVRQGQIEMLTRDHNLRTELLAAGIVPREAGTARSLRALTSYLGSSPDDLVVDVRAVALEPGDRLLLCTDGVYGSIAHPRLAEVARSGDATSVAEELVALRGADDATAIVIDFGNANASRSQQ